MTDLDHASMSAVEGVSPRSAQSRFKSGRGAMEPSGPAWSPDMQTAPRGHTEPVERKTKGGVVIDQVWRPDWIWAASKCGKVIATYFAQPTSGHPLGQWVSFRSDWEREPGDFEWPLAWRPFIEGEFPRVVVDKKATYPNGKTPEYPAYLFEVKP